MLTLRTPSRPRHTVCGSLWQRVWQHPSYSSRCDESTHARSMICAHWTAPASEYLQPLTSDFHPRTHALHALQTECMARPSNALHAQGWQADVGQQQLAQQGEVGTQARQDEDARAARDDLAAAACVGRDG